ncbi:hypothetical protein BKA67DRAFT_565168 [Truncatella angustata]|uniref:Uncharacterized protein n=1 Tax=Truncatella angustata TaxID=152316 RepID=A0A9P8ZX47_9PEZI|nr:uncharacterized protein BKA67DRAFT_565168 [Truncatella angustata]KAH6654437.1 hypothetical protein BKA67DRAFT_565168 [Truncatella angustata]
MKSPQQLGLFMLAMVTQAFAYDSPEEAIGLTAVLIISSSIAAYSLCQLIGSETHDIWRCAPAALEAGAITAVAIPHCNWGDDVWAYTRRVIG